MKILENSVILTAEELEEFSYEASDIVITDQTRWETHREGIIEIEGRNYQIYWSQGSTEMQDSSIEESGEFQEVVEREVLVKKWIPKK